MSFSENKTPEPVRFEKNFKAFSVAGLNETYSPGDPMNGPAQWEKFAPHLGNIPGQKGDVAYGVCFILSEGKGIEYMQAVEVSSDNDLPDGFTQKELPERNYAVFVHDDHVSTLRRTLDAISKWLPDSGYQKPEGLDFFFERYGEEFNPQTGKGDIEIWIPVKQV